MALTSVRARMGDTWIELTYNASTGRYEGYVTPTGTSFHQPGGYFNLTVQAQNATGQTATIDGTALRALRLVVKETDVPELILVSPLPGYLLTSAPSWLFTARDEADGSGINPASAKALVDGAERTCTVTAQGNGYYITFSASGLSEGPHTVTVSIADNDGNVANVSAAYIVDTVPPLLQIVRPDEHRVVDDLEIETAVWAWDFTSPEVSVRVVNNGVAVPVGPPAEISGAAAVFFPQAGGTLWRIPVPLEVGENHIQITARDGAGNETSEEVYMIRLVTDRRPADRGVLTALLARPITDWTAQELAWFNSAPCLRGSYDMEDLNRVGVAARHLKSELEKRGYAPDVQPKTDWRREDVPTVTPMRTYLTGVTSIRDAQPVEAVRALPLPGTMQNSTIDDWNNIERALIEADAIFPRYQSWTSGEITCGEA